MGDSYSLLFSSVGEKGNDARSFDRGREFSLVHSANAAHPSGKDLAAFGNKLFQAVYVFIVDDFDLFLAESADFSARSPFHGLSDGFFFHVIHSL